MKKLLLTVDTEGVRGIDPVRYQIWGDIGDGEHYGIPRIIDICDKYNIKALFFVDIAEVWHFGDEKIKEVIDYIIKKGHDVGVHIHPHHMPNESRHFLYEFSRGEQYDIIKKCTDKFIEMVGTPPTSFRAGKYSANYDTLDILDELGYKYDFSEFYSQKWCGIEPEIAYILPQQYKGLVEFPVSIYKSLEIPMIYERYDKFEITSNFSELKYVLNKYLKTNNDEVLILFLHSFSFIDFLDTPDKPTFNERNEKNAILLLDFLSNSNDFEFLSETDLDKININAKDCESNIVLISNPFYALLYFYLRAWKIIKTNRNAQILYTITFVLILLIIWIIF